MHLAYLYIVTIHFSGLKSFSRHNRVEHRCRIIGPARMTLQNSSLNLSCLIRNQILGSWRLVLHQGDTEYFVALAQALHTLPIDRYGGRAFHPRTRSSSFLRTGKIAVVDPEALASSLSVTTAVTYFSLVTSNSSLNDSAVLCSGSISL